MRKWVKEHGLLLANAGLFLAFFGGMILSGAAAYSEDQAAHGQPGVTVLEYLSTGSFVEATFENWESEFLQMAMYVILTVFLFQKGSSESKPMGKTAPQDQDPRDATIKEATPWPVKRGGLVLKLYEHSLSILLLLLFLASFGLHAAGGASAYSDEQQSHGQPAVTVLKYLGTSQFWFESFQNWQSEFLSVAVLVGASVYLKGLAGIQAGGRAALRNRHLTEPATMKVRPQAPSRTWLVAHARYFAALATASSGLAATSSN